MKGAVLYGPRDVRFEERPEPRIDNGVDTIFDGSWGKWAVEVKTGRFA